jgi:hypothetical protein
VLTRNSSGEMDLSPRRVGTHFRKLACRSDPVDEVLTAGGSTVWTSAPGHDRQALLMSRTVRLGRLVVSTGHYRPHGLRLGSPHSGESTQWFTRTESGSHEIVGSDRRPNKAMKLTKPEHIGALQLIAGVRPT